MLSAYLGDALPSAMATVISSCQRRRLKTYCVIPGARGVVRHSEADLAPCMALRALHDLLPEVNYR